MTAHDDMLVVIRRADPGDARRLHRLAQLDSQRVAPGELLVAEADGELLAAVAIDVDWSIADPFQRTAALVELLRLRAQQLRRDGGHARGRLRLEAPAPLMACEPL